MTAVPPSLIKECVNEALSKYPLTVDGAIKGSEVLKTSDRLKDQVLRLVVRRSGLSKKKLARAEYSIRCAISDELRSRVRLAGGLTLGRTHDSDPALRDAIMSEGGAALSKVSASPVTVPLLRLAAASNELESIKAQEASELGEIVRRHGVTPLVLQHSSLASRLRTLDIEIAEKRETARGELRMALGAWIGELRNTGFGAEPPANLASIAALAEAGALEARGDVWFNSIDWAAIADRDGVDVAALRDMGRALSEAAPEQRREILELVSRRLDDDARKRGELELIAAKVIGGLPPWKISGTVIVAGFEALSDGSPNPYDKLIGYKSTLPKDELARTAQRIVESWDSGMRRQVFEDEWPKLPGETDLQSAIEAAKAHVPEGVGMAIIAGHGDAAQYISNCDRGDMRSVLLEIAEKLGAQPSEPKKPMTELALQVLREWQCPPGPVRTAANLELLAMNIMRVRSILGWNESLEGAGDRYEAWRGSIKRERAVNERFDALLKRIDLAWPEEDEVFRHPLLSRFLAAWQRCAFARLEVGHKLAAALCLTDVPDDIETSAPWPAWSLVLPDGLLGEGIAIGDGNPFAPARIWCLGTEPKFAISTKGTLSPWSAEPEPKTQPVWTAVRNLIKGACLALSDPEKFRKERQHGGGTKAGKSKRSGPPELDQVRYLLSAPVTIDFREHLRESLTSHRHGGWTPKVQWLVRGHWRNQSYGPRHTLRRAKWIEPFMKGDPAARLLLRVHQVKDEET